MENNLNLISPKNIGLIHVFYKYYVLINKNHKYLYITYVLLLLKLAHSII